MVKYVIKRLATAIPVLLLVSLFSFLLIEIVPGDPSAEIAGPNASQEEIQRIRESLKLDRPLPERMVDWYSQILSGDLGQSILLNQSVTSAILQRMPVTISLTLLGLGFSILFGIPLGILAAANHNTFTDQAAMTGALIGLSLPDFWVGLIAIFVFSVALGWFPSGGYIALSHDPIGWLRSMALPSLALGISQTGLLARITRSTMLDVLGQDFMRTATAKGLPGWMVIGKHALKNVMIPIVTVLGVSFGLSLGGAIITETVFSLPGVGRLIVSAIQRRDFPVIQGGLMLTAFIFVFVNIVVDVLYALLDPRIRYDRA